jgi:type VI secretion system protein ImpK
MSGSGDAVMTGLPDLCSDLLAFALQLRKSNDPGSSEALRPRIDALFRALDDRARQADVPQEEVQLAKYALAAFIDEIILTSSWPVKEVWMGKPLQLEYFNDFSAGEEFYTKLEALRSANPRKSGVLEVYYLCLSLGFRGKYADLQGMEKKKVLLDTLSRELRPAGEAAGLSPSWQAVDQLPSLTKDFPAWVIAAACGLLVALAFALYKTLLSSAGGGLSDLP